MTTENGFEPIGLVRVAAHAAKRIDNGSGCGMPMPIEWRHRELARELLHFALVLQGRPKLKSQLKKAYARFYEMAEAENLFPGASESLRRGK